MQYPLIILHLVLNSDLIACEFAAKRAKVKDESGRNTPENLGKSHVSITLVELLSA